MNGKGIELKGVTKSYNEKVVLSIDNAWFETGSIYGLVGTNGVGKTTLLEILNGSIRPDKGEVLHNLQIEMVCHERGLFQELKVYENMYIGREKEQSKKKGPWIQWAAVRKNAEETLKKFKLNIDVDLPVRKLDPSLQKLLEVVIAISKDPDVLIIDEPLTLLDVNQVSYLNQLVKGFMSDQKMTIYSSHRLDELFQVIHQVVTMREGRIVAIQKAEEKVLHGLLEFAEKDIHRYPKRPIILGKNILEVKGLVTDHINGIDFELRRGEILGIVGLRDAYKSSVGKALFGAISAEGHIFVDGSEKRIRSTTHAVDAGICYIGSTNEGMFFDDSIWNNVVSANVPRVRRLSRSAKKLISKYYLEMLNISNEQADRPMSDMSAGNKQKVLLAKWFFSKSKIFIFNKPTSNIDVASKVDIYNIFSDLAESGAGIIMISNDLEEIAGMCDRVLVIEGGKIKSVLLRKELSVHRLVEQLQHW